MKVRSGVLYVVFAATFIQTAAGKRRPGGCTACWEANNLGGVDVNLECDGTYECGPRCPDGLHCPNCAMLVSGPSTQYVWTNRPFSNRCPLGGDCDVFDLCECEFQTTAEIHDVTLVSYLGQISKLKFTWPGHSAVRSPILRPDQQQRQTRISREDLTLYQNGLSR